ncbi:MAG: ThiS family [Clostridiales bacterium]|jgi:MoaD family protein|nr:ThiS family [Clostridiales bacterium]
MIRVRFFGFIRTLIDVSFIEIKAYSVDEALKLISNKYENIKLSTLKNSLVFVNSVDIRNLKMFKTQLKDGDEVMILSPTAGG